MIQELLDRRVPQILGAYLLAGWGLVQFVAFLEERYSISARLVDACGLFLILLVPAVTILAWAQGRPGKDPWQRGQLFGIGVFAGIATVTALIRLGAGPGAAEAHLVRVEDESGAIIERAIPAAGIRQRLMVFPFSGGEEGWEGIAASSALQQDLMQDFLLTTLDAMNVLEEGREAGYENLAEAPAALKRKIAEDKHFSWMVTGNAIPDANGWKIAARLIDIAGGDIELEQTLSGPELAPLIDELSLAIRDAIALPEWNGPARVDKPVSELFSNDTDALLHYAEGIHRILNKNDFAGGRVAMAAATEADPAFTLAHWMQVWSSMQLQDMPAAMASDQLAMQHLYRINEPMQFLIKASHYFLRQENDKGVKVLEMWHQLWPQDLKASAMLAFHRELRGELDEAVALYRANLDLDPRSMESLAAIARIERARANYEKAEAAQRRIVELHPQDTPGLLALCDILSSQNKFGEAEEILERSRVMEPGNFTVLLKSADISIDQGNDAAAEGWLEEATALASTSQQKMQLEDERRDLLLRQGRIREAISALDAWKDYGQESIQPLEYVIGWAVQLGDWALLEGGPARGLAVLDSACATLVPPYGPMAEVGKVKLLVADGQLDEAESLLERSEVLVEQLGIQAWAALLSSNRAQLAEAHGDLATARVAQTEILEFRPGSTSVARQLARLDRLQGKLNEADESVERLLEQSPHSPRLHLEAAHLAQAQGKPTAAQEYLELCLRVWANADPDYIHLQEALALRDSLRQNP